MVLLGRDLVDRVWDVKAKVEERFTEGTNKKSEKSQSRDYSNHPMKIFFTFLCLAKSNSRRPSGQAHGSN